ncbi:MAG: ATP-dependent RNA helicase HrpA [Magnetococcales bacterium]|nr:ATP-dependent RNA helicase HrpA [Magnetococcales bacterium]
MLRDSVRLRGRMQGLHRAIKSGRGVSAKALQDLQKQIESSIARRQKRFKSPLKPQFTSNLPVVQRLDDIRQCIQENSIVVLCGETGSGKTTQLPKILLDLGYGSAGMIGMTQPRRLAARSVAAFIAKDLGSNIGDAVGYKTRFQDRTGHDTRIKVMTDGILLAEIPSDRLLSSYDALIIDEAHERGVNIDFLLGFIKRIHTKRPDLKVVISSATLDIEKFSIHFDNAPILEVSGRTYPVELRYRPLDTGSSDDEGDALQEAIYRASRELRREDPVGDILVFLPGEREIRETQEYLEKRLPPSSEVLPLFARLSNAEQNRIFQPSTKQRLILSTNVAETSLTVPGIRFVIDSGLARISHYSAKAQVQRLPIEPVAQSSADQRKGRCGRLSDGICIRLYSEESFDKRPQFTAPELLRTSLSQVILRMAHLNLGHLEHFPLVDSPSPKAIQAGKRLLQELGAIRESGNLTPLGKKLARLPVDPRLGRMIMAGAERQCLGEILIITTALSVQDPRDRPLEKRHAADQAHQRFVDKRSDFLTLLQLWKHIQSLKRTATSKSNFQRRLKKEHLSPIRVREWLDTHRQLTEQCLEMKMIISKKPSRYQEIHKALLAGLLGNLGFKEDRSKYNGPQQSHFYIFPGSGLFKKSPTWVMAAELVETSRRYARICAAVEPEWIEDVAGDLCRKSWYEPHFDAKQGQVTAYERVSLFGLPIQTKRKVHYGPIDPQSARTAFISAALVERRLHSDAAFFRHNTRLIMDIERLEAKSRRRDLLVDNNALFDFFDEKLPPQIYTQHAFDQWRLHEEKRHPKFLFLTREFLMQHPGDAITSHQFPGHLTVGDQRFSLTYHFDPGDQRDGVSVTIPLPLLHQVEAHQFDRLAPGMLDKKIIALLKSLPKSYRRPLVPLPATAARCIKEMDHLDPYGKSPLTAVLARILQSRFQLHIPLDAWRLEDLPDHLRMNYKVVEEKSRRILAQGRDLDAIKREIGQQAKSSFQELPKESFEKLGIKRWDFGELPEYRTFRANGRDIHGYPALLEAEDGTVSIQLMESQESAEKEGRKGLRRLFLLQLNKQERQLRKGLPISKEAQLAYQPWGGGAALKKEIIATTAERVFLPDGPFEIRNAQRFQAQLKQGRGRFMREADASATLAETILVHYAKLMKTLSKPPSPTLKSAIPDIREQLQHLVYADFLSNTPAVWLPHLPRFIKGISLRLERRRFAPSKDDGRQKEVAPYWKSYLTLQKQYAAKKRPASEELILYRWMVEEYRISIFAQDLRCSMPISVKRIKDQKSKIPLP